MNKYEKEWEDVKAWANEEIDRITTELVRSGQFKPGLDTNSEHYKPIWTEVDRRLADIQRRMRENVPR